jgi:hypothetical protein
MVRLYQRATRSQFLIEVLQMSGRILLIHGTVTEIDGEAYFAAQKRITEFEDYVREVLRYAPQKNLIVRGHELLGLPPPVLDKLKAKAG